MHLHDLILGLVIFPGISLCTRHCQLDFNFRDCLWEILLVLFQDLFPFCDELISSLNRAVGGTFVSVYS